VPQERTAIIHTRIVNILVMCWLLIEENNGYKAQPDDNQDGGVMTYDFCPPVYEIFEVSLLDVDYPVWITVVYLDEESKMKEKPPIKVPL
jgi:hypothetical protein